MSQVAQGIGDAEFGFGRAAGEDQFFAVVEKLIEVPFGHQVQFGTGDDADASVSDAYPGGDAAGGEAVVAGDDDEPDSCGVAPCDGVGDFGAGRVEHRNESEESQVSFGFLTGQRSVLWRGEVPFGDCQDPQALVGPAVHDRARGVALRLDQGPFSAVRGDPGAQGQQFLGSALAMEADTVGCAVDGGHAPQGRVEVELGQPLERMPVGGHAEGDGGAQQGQFGGVAAFVAFAVDTGVIACDRRRGQPRGRGSRPCGWWCHIQAEGPAGSPDVGDAHEVHGQGTGFVSADDAGRAQGFDRGDSFHQGAPAGEDAHADGQGEGDGGKQAFGDIGDEQPDREVQSVAQGQVAEEGTHGDERDAHGDGDDGYDPRHPGDLLLERALVVADAFGERGNPAKFGLHAGGENHGGRFPAGAAGAAENHVRGLKQRSFWRAALRAPEHGKGFPGKGGDVHFHGTLEEPGVGADAVAFAHHQHIPRDQQPGLDLLLLTVAQDPRLRRQIGREGLDRPFRVAFLEESEPRVEEDDRDDCRR